MAKAYLGKFLGMFLVELQVVDAKLFQFVLAVEEIEHVPDVACHLFGSLLSAVLALVHVECLGYSFHPVVTKDGTELGCRGTSRHTLRHAEVELVWLFASLLRILVVAFSCYLLGYLLKVKVGLAHSIEERLNLVQLHFVQGTRFHVIRVFDAHVVEEGQHAELLIQRMRITASWFVLLEGTFAHALTLAFERTLEVKSAFQFMPYLLA